MATPTYTDKFSPRSSVYQDKYPARGLTPLTWSEAVNSWDEEGRTWDETARTRTQFTPKYT